MIAKNTKLAKLNMPASRKLRAYAFDPSLSISIDTASVNIITYKVPWEELMADADNPGRTVPVGEYIEIVDYDPASKLFYPPVDMNDLFSVAQEGLNPSVGNPQFHQQMVYAVVMTTIKNFELALGRKVQWSEHLSIESKPPHKKASGFVKRLRIYPHALRQANAYYNPLKKALLFGYFPAKPASAQLQLPGGTVFTCLSHDIIAHETTHAILDGLHQRYVEANHPDTRAFHEGFADLIALFQHFTFPEVLKHQIARTRGDLAAQNLLGELAQQFGKAMGSYGSLRDAIGSINEQTGKWAPAIPNSDDYITKAEFHERGAILVAAVFDAFLTIYKERIKTFLRIATGGSGILENGDLHPDMVNVMAETAADTASQILKICVRALDYCPPIDINYGDYLRAIITADLDMIAEDKRNYRVAFIEAFQKRGIFPSNIKSMSVESLAYEPFPELQLYDNYEQIFVLFLREFKNALAYETNRGEIFKITQDFIRGGNSTRMGLHERINQKFLQSAAGNKFAEVSGLLFLQTKKECDDMGFSFSAVSDSATYEIENLWLASRIAPDNRIVNHVIVTLLQKRGIRYRTDADGQVIFDRYFDPNKEKPADGFIFRGGCTLIFDLDTMKLKYAIKKDINDLKRMQQQYNYTSEISKESFAAYFSSTALSALSGPFSFMHSFTDHH